MSSVAQACNVEYIHMMVHYNFFVYYVYEASSMQVNMWVLIHVCTCRNLHCRDNRLYEKIFDLKHYNYVHVNDNHLKRNINCPTHIQSFKLGAIL